MVDHPARTAANVIAFTGVLPERPTRRAAFRLARASDGGREELGPDVTPGPGGPLGHAPAVLGDEQAVGLLGHQGVEDFGGPLDRELLIKAWAAGKVLDGWQVRGEPLPLVMVADGCHLGIG